MSVAENPVIQATQQNPRQQLAITSAIGAVILLAGLWFIFAGVPILWSSFWEPFWANLGYVKNDFLSSALLIMIEIGVIVALGYGAYRLLAVELPFGTRAGVIVLSIGIVVACWLAVTVGNLMEARDATNSTIGWAVAVVVGAAVLGGLGYVFLMVPAFSELLETVEGQGWVSGNSYKGNQGVRVRRGSIIGLLVVGACGIITLSSNRSFGADRMTDAGMVMNDWYWVVPFTTVPGHYKFIPLMYKLHVVLPLVLGILLVWIAWRLVNVPAFADFLIATEAEMNKVSWTTRKRLVADTIVVLVTVFLFTGFLFVVDIVWIKVLSMPYVEVLIIDFKKEQQKQQEQAEW